jgi:hypothetical protein
MTTLQYYQSSDKPADLILDFLDTFKGHWISEDTYRLQSKEGETVTLHGTFAKDPETSKDIVTGLNDMVFRDADGKKVAVLDDYQWGQWEPHPAKIQQTYFTALQHIDLFIGTEGSDVIAARTELSSVSAGAGNDTVLVLDQNPFLADSAARHLSGDQGVDTLDLSRLDKFDNGPSTIDGVDISLMFLRQHTLTFQHHTVDISGFENYIGTDYADVFSDSQKSETFNGGRGDDYVESYNGGDDTFIFGAGDDHDLISGFSIDTDKIAIKANLGIESFSQIKHFMSSETNDGNRTTVIDFGDNDVLEIDNYGIEHLNAHNFIFH